MRARALTNIHTYIHTYTQRSGDAVHNEDSSRSRRPEEVAERLYKEGVEQRKQLQERLEAEKQV